VSTPGLQAFKIQIAFEPWMDTARWETVAQVSRTLAWAPELGTLDGKSNGDEPEGEQDEKIGHFFVA
jgi:hypothetical protein